MDQHGDLSHTSSNAGGRSVWQNLIDVVFAPGATFDDVREHPRWLVPLLVVTALTLVVSFLMRPVTLELQRAQMAGRGMTPEQIESALGMVRVFSLIGAPVAVVVFTALFALLFWGWAAISGAHQASYKVAFTAMIYTGVIQILQAVAQTIVVFTKGAEQVAREGGPPTFGLALFLDRGDMPGLLWGFLANINFFSIWGAVVLAIAGIHAMRMSQGAAYAFAIVMWLLGGVFLSLQPGG